MFQSMFQSATFKLTAWYIAILMTISIIFSIVIYQLNFHEVNLRLENYQHNLTTAPGAFSNLPEAIRDELRVEQSRQAAVQMIITLVYVNLFILVGGSIGGYWLARRTLTPLEQAHEAQSRFTSDASHELRTPLASMKAELEVMLREKTISAEEAREVFESNLEEVNKLTALSEMLLKLARLDYDQLEKQTIDIVEITEKTLKEFSESKKRFSLTTRKKALAYGNEAALREVLHIIIDNALKYSPAKSPITLRIFEKRSMITVEVVNKSNHLSDEQIRRVFDRFYRADTARTHSMKDGYGLGLAIAQRITTIHSGDIALKHNNGTTTVTFCLPSTRKLQAKTTPTITL